MEGYAHAGEAAGLTVWRKVARRSSLVPRMVSGLIYRRYRHLFPSEVREAVSMLDRMVAETAANAELGGSTSGQ